MDTENINITFDYDSFSQLNIGDISIFKNIVIYEIIEIKKKFESFLSQLTAYVNVDSYIINISHRQILDLFQKKSNLINVSILCNFAERTFNYEFLIDILDTDNYQYFINCLNDHLNDKKLKIGYIYRNHPNKNEVDSSINETLFLNNNDVNDFFSKYITYFDFVKIIITGDSDNPQKTFMSIYSNDKKWSGFVTDLSNEKAILKALYDIKAFHFNHDEIDQNEIIEMLEANALIGY